MIRDILDERQKKYGEFYFHAQITQNLKKVMQDSAGWHMLSDHHKEALDMIMHKVGRILNGDPNYDDSWIDIAGYAQLEVDLVTTKTPEEGIKEAFKKAAEASDGIVFRGTPLWEDSSFSSDLEEDPAMAGSGDNAKVSLTGYPSGSEDIRFPRVGADGCLHLNFLSWVLSYNKLQPGTPTASQTEDSSVGRVPPMGDGVPEAQ